MSTIYASIKTLNSNNSVTVFPSYRKKTGDIGRLIFAESKNTSKQISLFLESSWRAFSASVI